MASILEHHGARVKAVESAATALSVLEGTSGFDALVCDIAMPREDGYSLIRKVRAMSGPISRCPPPRSPPTCARRIASRCSRRGSRCTSPSPSSPTNSSPSSGPWWASGPRSPEPRGAYAPSPRFHVPERPPAL
ncbi:response regulator [Cystobacter fuscus]